MCVRMHSYIRIRMHTAVRKVANRFKCQEIADPGYFIASKVRKSLVTMREWSSGITKGWGRTDFELTDVLDIALLGFSIFRTT